jgi:hypothetical protein
VAAEWHIINFDRLCGTIKTPNLDPGILRVKLFPYSLTRKAKLWYENAPKKDLKSWFNLRASFLERFGKCTLLHKKYILDFKQQENETLTHAWVRSKKITYNMEHGLRDWMLTNSFYYGLNNDSMCFLDKEVETHFINKKPYEALSILDGILVETNICKSLDKVKNLDLDINEEKNSDGNVEVIVLKESTMFLGDKKFEKQEKTTNLEPLMITNDKQVEEVKMLSETREPLLDLDKCSLNELITILQKFSNDPSINIHQAGLDHT